MKILLDLLDLLDDPRVTGESSRYPTQRLGRSGRRNENHRHERKNHGLCQRPHSRSKRQDCRRQCSDPRHCRPLFGGLGARPALIGFTSDGDGALAALTIAAKLGQMHVRGDILEGDVMIRTHVCPNAPARVPRRTRALHGLTVTSAQCNAEEVDPAMDALLEHRYNQRQSHSRRTRHRHYADRQGWLPVKDARRSALHSRIPHGMPAEGSAACTTGYYPVRE